MSASPRNWRDSFWRVWFCIHVAAILLADAVPSYPAWLYKPEGSPLHFLQLLQDAYLSMYNDPFVQEDLAPRWIRPLFAIELLFQLPVAAYASYQLRGKAGTTGPLELLLLCYAFEVALSTLLCVNDVFYWDPVEYPPEVKNDFIFKLYGPWLVTPLLLFADMYWRLFSRVSSGSDAVKKAQ
ncbi:hypothetical protein NKR23_g8632 [Pleurostoma richardsiae]|uniref:Efficient mitochondria targeting-associated protein 19 n=1 Tax=Pleurostoma richardsiae TaxID=41990 RepID=A0AA38RSJ7_9PEZI|nr:hypothetical protein NKR23_g8632 [Pleurostoma richardsiae]